MALPPWTVELLRRGVQDLARQVSDPETARALKDQAAQLVDELPRVAKDKVGAILQQAESAAEPLKQAMQGDAWKQSGDVGQWLSSTFGSDSSPAVAKRITNASGVLVHPSGSGIAVSSEVINAALPWLSGDLLVQPDATSQLLQQITDSIQQVTHNAIGEAYSTIVFNGIESAIASVASLGGRGGCVWVPRCCAISKLRQKDYLADLLRSFHRGSVREFGGADCISLEDIESLQLRDNRQNLLVHLEGPATSCLANAQLPTGMKRVSVVPVGTIPTLESLPSSAPSLTKAIQGGADAVVLGGGVLTGTPGLAILFGKTNLLQPLLDSRTTLLQASPLPQVAMMEAAISQIANGKSPLDELLSTSEENLTSRAERMVTQLRGVREDIHVQVRQLPAMIETDGEHIASRQIAINVPGMTAKTLANSLLAATPVVLTRSVDDQVLLDLKWVSPAQQSQLFAIIADIVRVPSDANSVEPS